MLTEKQKNNLELILRKSNRILDKVYAVEEELVVFRVWKKGEYSTERCSLKHL
jgi:hypothetical protein